MARLLTLHFDRVEAHVVAVHQLGEKNRRVSEELTQREYDAVFTQPISDSYPLECARTSEIKKRFGIKVLTWPNAYYRGYNPELQYLRRGGQHTLGPLGDYHVSSIVSSFHRGDSVEVGAKLLNDEKYNLESYGSVAATSLAELKAREHSTDVGIADFIEEIYLRQRLFFSFNHPSNRVLFEIGKRLAEKSSLRLCYPFQGGVLPELLAHIYSPVNPCVPAQFGSGRTGRRVHLGIAGADGVYAAGAKAVSRFYTDEELTAAFYLLYERAGPETMALQRK